MLRPLAHRNYRLWAAADVVSVAGTWMQVLGLNWLVLSVTGSATAMGFSVLLQALPVLLLGGWGGALADRLPARPVLVTCQVLRAALSVGLAAAVLGGGRSMWLVYAVTLLTGAITAVEAPTLGRFGSTLVGRETLGSAVALGSVLSSAGRILGMALGGLVAGVAGPAPLFLINAVSFIAVIAALSAIRAGELHPIAAAAPGTADGGVRAGLRYLLGQPVILVVLGLSFLLGGLGRNYQLTMAAMAAGPLDAGAAGVRGAVHRLRRRRRAGRAGGRGPGPAGPAAAAGRRRRDQRPAADRRAGARPGVVRGRDPADRRRRRHCRHGGEHPAAAGHPRGHARPDDRRAGAGLLVRRDGRGAGARLAVRRRGPARLPGRRGGADHARLAGRRGAALPAARPPRRRAPAGPVRVRGGRGAGADRPGRYGAGRTLARRGAAGDAAGPAGLR